MIQAPTIADAEAAGCALTGAGAREVLVFGSVARGDAASHSDIDLVVILDDLDYRLRRRAAGELNDLAAAAAGHHVDIWLTDIPEWTAQNQRAASFAAAIRNDLVAVASAPGDDSAVRWDKEQVMAQSDTEAAWVRLEETHTQLDRLATAHTPYRRELEAAAAGDTDKHHRLRADRLIQACVAAAMAIETAFKALGTNAQIDPQLLHHNHRIDLIVKAPNFHPADANTARRILVHPATFESVAAWRTLGDYQPRPDQPQPQELATSSYVSAVAEAAVAVAEYASDKMGLLHGPRPVNDSIAATLSELRDLAGIDTATGEPALPEPVKDTGLGI